MLHFAGDKVDTAVTTAITLRPEVNFPVLNRENDS